jgi:hypothetical protein
LPIRLKLALRDLSVLTATLALWLLDPGPSWPAADSSATANAVAVLTGVLTVVCAYLAHEWGHLAGARLVRAVVHHPDTIFSVFLFRFDSDRNDRRQFLAMSLGGFLASAAAIAVLLEFLPRTALAGRLALVLALLGVIATAILELPPAWRVVRGAPIPTGAADRSSS